MGYKIIPLTSDPDQQFNCVIPVDNKNIKLSFRLRYNTEAEYWVMSITKDGSMLVDSLPLLYSEFPAADVMGQYSYFGIGSACICKTSTTELDRPDNASLGDKFVLVWGDTVV